MGHSVGGEAKDYFAEARLLLRSDLHFTFGFNYQKRGLDQSVKEEHYMSSAEVTWWMNDTVRFEALGSFDRADNFDYENNNDQDFYYSRVSMILSW